MSATIEAAPVSAMATGVFPLGGNLQFQNEVTRDHAMADLVKSTTGFRDLDGVTMASVGADGWATADFIVPLWGHTVDQGRYRISFTGPSTTVISTVFGDSGILTNVTPAGSAVQHYTLDVRGTDVEDMSLKFTGTNGQVKDLKVIQPGNADGEVWSGKYVEFLKQLGPDTIRVMDMAKINDNVAVNWADRPLATDVTFTNEGVPWEHLVTLANEVDANLWVPVPARANDDYVRQLAALLKAELEPGLDVYVEYANETWSTLHEPGKFNLAQAKAEVAANPNSNLKYDGTNDSNKWQYRRNARRLKEIVEQFREVWTTTVNGTTAEADPINDEVKAILGGRASEDVWFDDMLKYINANYGAPSNYFYGGAGAWYFSMNKFRDELIAGRNDLTVDQVLEGLEISAGLYESERRFRETANRLEPWGLKLAAYELGVDTMGGLNTGAKAAAHRDLRIMPLMDRFVRAFEDQGGVVANWYTIGARQFNTPDGAWAVTDNLRNVLSPKAREFRVLRGVPDPERAVGEIDVARMDGGVATTPLSDDQSAVVDFGQASVGATGPTITFEVRNDDYWPLSLTLGAAPAGFEVVEGLAAFLIPGTSDTFTLRLVGAGDVGSRSGTIEITTDDLNENPFSFPLQGTVSTAVGGGGGGGTGGGSGTGGGGGGGTGGGGGGGGTGGGGGGGDAPGIAVTTVSATKVPAVVISGSGPGRRPVQGLVSVTVRNDTGAAFVGPVTLSVHGSGDAVLDAGDAQIATLTRTLKLGVGATSKAVKLKVPLSTLPTGSQTLLATATAGTSAATMAGPTVSVEAPRVNLIGQVNAPPALKPLVLGKRATLAVALQNTGNVATARSPVSYVVLFTTDGTEAGQVFATTVNGKVNLKPGTGKPQKVALTLPAGGTLAAGTYTVLVRLNAELNQTNGQTVALMPVTVV